MAAAPVEKPLRSQVTKALMERVRDEVTGLATCLTMKPEKRKQLKRLRAKRKVKAKTTQ
jgi:hypothetical protein